MPIPLIYGITVAFGFLFWSVVAAQYIWPATLLLVTHVLVFRLLMRKQAAAPASVVAGLPK